MSPEIFLSLLAFAFVTSITPGPNNLMLLSSGVNFGFRRTIPHMLGIGIGFVVLLLAVGAGLGALVSAVPWLFPAIKITGGAYLLYLAWHIATGAPPEAETAGSSKSLSFTAAAIFQWVNPKAWIMAITAMATYTKAGEYWVTMVLVAATFGVVNLPCISSWVGLGITLRTWLNDRRRLAIFNTVMALTLVASLWPMLH